MEVPVTWVTPIYLSIEYPVAPKFRSTAFEAGRSLRLASRAGKPSFPQDPPRAGAVSPSDHETTAARPNADYRRLNPHTL